MAQLSQFDILILLMYNQYNCNCISIEIQKEMEDLENYFGTMEFKNALLPRIVILRAPISLQKVIYVFKIYSDHQCIKYCKSILFIIIFLNFCFNIFFFWKKKDFLDSLFWLFFFAFFDFIFSLLEINYFHILVQ